LKHFNLDVEGRDAVECILGLADFGIQLVLCVSARTRFMIEQDFQADNLLLLAGLGSLGRGLLARQSSELGLDLVLFALTLIL
jgi:hypothetical protein